MLALKRLVCLSLALVVPVLLSGCLRSEIKLLGEWGDRMRVGSNFGCIISGGDSLTTYRAVEERLHGNPSKFRYIITQEGQTDSLVVVTKETDQAGLYLIQMTDTNADPTFSLYMWYNELTGSISYFGPSEFDESEKLQRDLEKYGVTVTYESYVHTLDGTREGMADFLSAQSQTPKTHQFTCVGTL